MHRVLSLSAVIARNVADAATSTAPVAAPAATEAAKPVAAAKPAKRVLASVKPASAKPAATAKPVVVAKPAAATGKPAKPAGNVTRTASTIAAAACNFGNLSDRDSAYMRFYAGLAASAANGVVTLRAIVDSGKRPEYSPSNKPHDAGVIQRLAKAGLLTVRDNGAAFVFTAKAKTHAAYVAGAKR